MSDWGEYVHGIAAQMALYRESARRLCELAGLRPGMAVVDLGAGTGLAGLAALELVPEGLELVVVEPNPSLLAAARARIGDRAGAYHTVDPVAAADLVPGKVDRVICNLALLSFRDPEGVLRAWRNRIKPTGRFCFSLSGTYFNVLRDQVTPQYVFIQELHRQGLLPRGLPSVERLPNQRSVEGTLKGAGYKPARYEVQEIPTARPETEPGGELYNLMRIHPALPGKDHRDAVERTLAALPAAAPAIASRGARWQVVHFVAQPALTPEELLLERFGGGPPG
ncbi:class I SAM-dependent methyltransferase [Symbiobacterium thermophilum]|uniref:class I SAM-dependent methyltransferase n=1 Tax=Symbiobacterium thermophilum TaxID=2734 RepID=UPI000321D08A|nr:methyltransferase [Symbiobacterium thermophilum]